MAIANALLRQLKKNMKKDGENTMYGTQTGHILSKVSEQCKRLYGRGHKQNHFKCTKKK